ncbi:MAG: hypothetical protein ACFFDN_32335 [Candidatus Hodarchaeota archaeon]
MKCLVLSHFDRKNGPKTFIKVGDEIPETYLDEIPRYMDYHDEGYFIHEYGKIKSANIIFLIPNPLARGGSEIVMISVVLIEENMEPRNFYTTLNQFIENIKDIDDVQTSFYLNKNKNSGAYETHKKVKNLMWSTYKTLPLKPVYIISDGAKVLMLNLNKEDNSTLIDFLKKVQNQSTALINR